MARGVNKVILVGTLGKDPETKYLPNGGAVTSFSVATSESWKDKATGEKQERVEWHRISMFGKLAEIAAQYLSKGSQVYLEGKLQTRKWADKDGQDRYTTEVVVDSMQMLDGFKTSENKAESSPKAQQNTPSTADPKDRGFEDFEDDIPF